MYTSIRLYPLTYNIQVTTLLLNALWILYLWNKRYELEMITNTILLDDLWVIYLYNKRYDYSIIKYSHKKDQSFK